MHIQEAEIKFLLVCESDGILLGTVTDGDVRRAVSDLVDLEGSVVSIMNRLPKVARANEGIAQLRTRMRASAIKHMPRVDPIGRVIDVVLLDSTVNVRKRDSSVVLMAGGRGSRLMPLTADLPKPLLEVGRMPVIERQIDQLIGHGFHRFYISVNYLGHLLEEYFGDGSKLGVEISYLRESDPLGTAGALSLLDAQQHPVLLMNADIITKADFGTMLDCFIEQDTELTVGVREHQYTVPYGCVTLECDQITSLDEKPTFRHLINAGIYVLSLEALKLVPQDKYFDMTQLVQKIIDNGKSANCFLISEEWIDIGNKEDLMWARKVFAVEEKND